MFVSPRRVYMYILYRTVEKYLIRLYISKNKKQKKQKQKQKQKQQHCYHVNQSQILNGALIPHFAYQGCGTMIQLNVYNDAVAYIGY